ncbi:MAG: patatin family protein [Bacteroidaceae bacterium]|nr:patatin family protein [Bacteroidaceae bacterium]
MESIGLVLEGGALRGLYSAGICDVLMEAGIEPDGIIGVSAGAAFGCNIKSRQPGRPIRYNMRFAREWRYCSLRSLIQTGDLFGAEFAYHTLPRELDRFDDETFEHNPVPFWVVCTDVETGQAVYKQLTKGGDYAYEWIRASASMPLCSRVVELDGMKLLDGGVSDSIPLKFMEAQGYKRNIVILTQPANYVKGKNRLLPLMQMSKLRHYPNFLEAVRCRHEMYNAELEYVRQQEQAGCCLVFRPDTTLEISHTSHDPKAMRRVYEIGRRQAETRLSEVKSFLCR